MASYASPEGFRQACKLNLQMLGRLAAAKYCTTPGGAHPLQLAPAEVEKLDYHLYHLWELFDKAEIVPSDERVTAASTDEAFQRFLHEQCLKDAP